MSRVLRFVLVVFVFTLVLAGRTLQAQNVGSLQGTVTDASGSGVAGVTVTATDLSSAVAHTTTTGPGGPTALRNSLPRTTAFPPSRMASKNS